MMRHANYQCILDKRKLFSKLTCCYIFIYKTMSTSVGAIYDRRNFILTNLNRIVSRMFHCQSKLYSGQWLMKKICS